MQNESNMYAACKVESLQRQEDVVRVYIQDQDIACRKLDLKGACSEVHVSNLFGKNSLSQEETY